MTVRRKEIGKYGEQLAKRQYLLAGYKVITLNYRCRFGEIDLILERDDTLVFSEVRTKTSDSFGTGEESVTDRKQHKIRKVSQYFLLKHPQYSHYNIQYDVISIYLDLIQKKAWMNRIKDAF